MRFNRVSFAGKKEGLEERKQLSCLEDLNLVTVIGCKQFSGEGGFLLSFRSADFWIKSV